MSVAIVLDSGFVRKEGEAGCFRFVSYYTIAHFAKLLRVTEFWEFFFLLVYEMSLNKPLFRLL